MISDAWRVAARLSIAESMVRCEVHEVIPYSEIYGRGLNLKPESPFR